MADSRYFEIVTSPYLGENSSDFNKIWYMSADYEPDESRMSRIEIFLNPRWRTAAILDLLGKLWDHPRRLSRDMLQRDRAMLRDTAHAQPQNWRYPLVYSQKCR